MGTSGNHGDVMVSTLVHNARDVILIPILCAIFSIFLTPTTYIHMGSCMDRSTRRATRMRRALWEISGLGSSGLEPWLSQTNELKIDTCRFLARCSAFLGLDKDWFQTPDLPHEHGVKFQYQPTGRSRRIGRALVSRAGDRGFKPWSTKTNGL